MNLVVADNQPVTAVGTMSNLFTDPIELGQNDRATVNFTVHYLWTYNAGGGGTAASLGYQAQVSNDGVYWASALGGGDSATAATGSTPQQLVFPVNGKFVRFSLTFITVSGTLSGAAFDLHVKFDHA